MNTSGMRTQAEKFRDQAWTLRSENEFAQAILMYESSRDLYRQLGNQSKQSSVLMEMGDTAMQMGDYDLARYCYDRAWAIFGTDQIPMRHKINLLDGLKTISLHQNNYKQALLELLQLAKVYEENPGMPRERASTLQELGEVTVQLGQIADSDRFFAEALRWGDQDDEQAIGILWAWGTAHYQREQHIGSRLCQLAFLRAESAFESLVETTGFYSEDLSTKRRRALLESLRHRFNALITDNLQTK
jgi:tetratricopeptide (TPR) repeat protein